MRKTDKSIGLSSILLATDDQTLNCEIESALSKVGFGINFVDSFMPALEIAKAQNVDLVLADLQLEDGNCLEFLSNLRMINGNIGVIVITAKDSKQDALEALRNGARDYISKPLLIDELVIRVENVLGNQKVRRELTNLREEIAWKYGFDSFVGNSKSIDVLKNLAAQAARSDIPVLITGEPGTGKELLAKSIHYHSRRRKNRFVPIACASIPENILEEELFRIDEAVNNRQRVTQRRLFNKANRGSVFFDDFEEIPPNLQSKILDFICKPKTEPFDIENRRDVDIRVIIALNRFPTGSSSDKSHGEKLLSRLNFLPLSIPPLRERPDDIPLLTEHFIKAETTNKEGEECNITAEAMKKLIGYDWPGNVRELENTIKRAMTLCRDGKILPDDVWFISPNNTRDTKSGPIKIDKTESGTLEDSLKQRIETTLYANDWNLTQTAIKLGIGRTTLWRKIKKYDLRRSEEIPEK